VNGALRNTSGFESEMDQAVQDEGHGGCGGYFTSRAGEITCVCGSTLEAATALQAGRTVTGAGQ
jgi:hypothetical protein